MKKILSRIFLGIFVLSGTLVLGVGESLYVEPVTYERLNFFPNPPDFRNYFFLQSIGDTTSIVIGDFTGSRKLIALIVDENSDNTIDKIYQYYPDKKQFRKTNRCTSQFFNDNIAQMKRDIISGKIYRDNYSYNMASLDSLLAKIQEGFDIIPTGTGYTVRIYDPDSPSASMSDFYFNKNLGRYDLQFKTNYYTLFNMKIVPPIPFSVYCKNSKDPVVAETVDSLLKNAAGK
jgi:hypothetical protein